MSTVFLLGATGYVGGSLLVALRKVYPDISIKALARSEANFPAIKAAGATPVKGSFSDNELITRLSAEAKIVINAADSDDVGLLNAILLGLKRRKEEGKPVGRFIHVSGAAIFLDGSKEGKSIPGGKIWTDSEEDIKSLTPSMAHGQVDVPLLKASEEGYFDSFIVNPPFILGSGSGPVSRASIFLKMLVGLFTERKEAFYVNEGTNIFTFVHIDDLVELLLIVFRLALEGDLKAVGTSPYARYYIASSGSLDWKTAVTSFAVELHKVGRIASPVPASVSFNDISELVAAGIWSSNVVLRSDRARSLGWKPKHLDLESNLDSVL